MRWWHVNAGKMNAVENETKQRQAGVGIWNLPGVVDRFQGLQWLWFCHGFLLNVGCYVRQVHDCQRGSITFALLSASAAISFTKFLASSVSTPIFPKTSSNFCLQASKMSTHSSSVLLCSPSLASS